MVLPFHQRSISLTQSSVRPHQAPRYLQPPLNMGERAEAAAEAAGHAEAAAAAAKDAVDAQPVDTVIRLVSGGQALRTH